MRKIFRSKRHGWKVNAPKFAVINTTGNEVSPVLADGRTLYFASMGIRVMVG